VREIEQAGGAGIEIEDQRLPTQAHCHKGQGYTVPFAPGEVEAINAQLHPTVHLPAYWELERRTVEKDAAR
jgi:2-methylisocitrate lyase-like PEP mutase family enzyme